MAYIRAGRAVRSGRQSFVPGGAACAAAARRFTLSLTPLFVSPTLETAEGQLVPKLSTRITRGSASSLLVQPAS